MSVLLLTDAIVKSAQCKPGARRQELCDSLIRGMLLEIRPSNKSSYYLRYKSDGQTKYIKLGTSDIITLADARKKARTLKAEIELGADPRGEANARKEVLTYAELFELYMNHARVHKRSHYSDESLYRLRIKNVFGNMRLNKITRHQIQSFHTDLKTEGLAPASCDHYIKLLKHSLNLAIDWGFLTGPNPASRVPLFNVDNRVENYLDEEALGRLMHVLQTDHNRPICLLVQWLLATGMRLGAALALRWDHVNRERRVILTSASSAKSKRNSSLPLNNAALAILDQLDTEGKYEFLFVNSKTGKPFVNVFKVWDRLRKQAGLPHFRLHDGRHTFASLLANQNVSLFTIQALLQHKSPVTSQRYSHLSSSVLLSSSECASQMIQNAMKRKPEEVEHKPT